MKKAKNARMTASDRNMIRRYLGADIKEADILKVIAGETSDRPASDDMLMLAAAYELGRRVRDGYA